MPTLEQRWTRPLDVEPGHWKKQLPTKHLKLAAKNDLAGLKTLLKSDPETLNRRANHGRTLLWEAVRAGKKEAVQYLIRAGANLDLTGCYNSEAHVQLTPYCAAVYYRRTDLASYLMPRCGPPDIFRLAFLGDEDPIIAKVKADPTVLQEEDPYDEIFYMPLLAFAFVGGHLTLSQRLIEQGAALVPYSSLLYFLAAKDGRGDFVELLASAGAVAVRLEDTLVVTKDFDNFQRLLELHRDPASLAPALLAIVRGDRAERPDKARALLDYGAPINRRGAGGKTALHLAAGAGRLELTELLLERGADPTLKDEDGRTALELAEAAKKTQAAALLKGR